MSPQLFGQSNRHKNKRVGTGVLGSGMIVAGGQKAQESRVVELKAEGI